MSTSLAPEDSTALKLTTARQKKETADQAFKTGNLKDGGGLFTFRTPICNLCITNLFDLSALRSYHEVRYTNFYDAYVG